MPPISIFYASEPLPEGIVLATAATANGFKITIFLEKLGVPYHILSINLRKGEHKQPWFTKWNPYGAIPVLLEVNSQGEVISSMSESVAILVYLGEKYDKERRYYKSTDDPLYFKQMELLFIQASSLGPAAFEAFLYRYMSPVEVRPALERSKNENIRGYNVLEEHLKNSKTGYFLGGSESIVDFAVMPWISNYESAGIKSLDQWPHLKLWLSKLKADPVIRAAMSIPTAPFELPKKFECD